MYGELLSTSLTPTISILYLFYMLVGFQHFPTDTIMFGHVVLKTHQLYGCLHNH